MAMDHEARYIGYGERCDRVLTALGGLSGVIVRSPGVQPGVSRGKIEAYRISQRELPRPVIRDGVRIVFPDTAGAQRLIEALKQGEPSIFVRIDDASDQAVNVSVAFSSNAELAVITRRLVEELSR